MKIQLEEYPSNAEPLLQERNGLEEASPTIAHGEWRPLYWHNCSFPPEVFYEVMMNLIKNPNINSNHLFRADILFEAPYNPTYIWSPESTVRIILMQGFSLETVMIRKFIPRNILVDKPMDQTCLIYSGTTDSEPRSLVVYLPHIVSPAESPFYHPAVRGIAFLHTFNTESKEGLISIHYSFFDSGPQTPVLDRTAQHLLAVLHKHGQGQASGYVKKFHHDTILSQATVQTTYARLKAKYARILCSAWVEATDPTKHVFEDLGIAAFLIELWAKMYSGQQFPGFVDIGCGNGLLVRILTEEGYSGWGFDARRRKSWETYAPEVQTFLKERVLIPSILQEKTEQELNHGSLETPPAKEPRIHSGIFPEGTFIISNHADELTPWTPILANISRCPFLVIPCCSHNLTGAKFRAPPTNKPGVSSSAYASLVTWVTMLATDCGWDVEKELLRIPSTRNTALLGRRRNMPYENIDTVELLQQYGGAEGWQINAMKLVKATPRGH